LKGHTRDGLAGKELHWEGSASVFGRNKAHKVLSGAEVGLSGFSTVGEPYSAS